MNSRRLITAAVFAALTLGATTASAQQPQIPSLQVCNSTVARGSALIAISSRVDFVSSGTFRIRLDLGCDPSGDGYPTGGIVLFDISMSDSTIQGAINVTTMEQVTTSGKHTPTLWVNGRCEAENIRGCRYWLMVVDNQNPAQARGTADIVSFLVFDGTGNRVAYGTGPVVDGDVFVAPTSN